MRKGDLRRERIIDAAEEIFFTKGYEETSLQDILDALSLSKGGFYHHFDSKASVLLAVCERRVEKRLAHATADLRTLRGGACERMNRLLGLAGLFEREEPRFVAMLMRLKLAEGDVQIRDKMACVTMETLLPLADEIVEMGLEEGVFHTRYPATTGRLLLLLARQMDEEFLREMLKNGCGPDNVIGLVELADTYRNAAELMLNAPYGSLRIVDIDALLENYRAAQEAANAFCEAQTERKQP
ncbi:MAG: TetR/AcrR family transcriptional regulator [Eubacteriales bacterium]|nr:TetR/AcrR family transcriptional regulator [Eubacteriales bacterium]